MKTENVNLLLYCCLLENIMIALYFDAHRVLTYREYIIRKYLNSPPNLTIDRRRAT